VDATAGAPSGIAVRGHSRWDVRRLFDETTVRIETKRELKDN
jgi:hypothetical protein